MTLQIIICAAFSSFGLCHSVFEMEKRKQYDEIRIMLSTVMLDSLFCLERRRSNYALIVGCWRLTMAWKRTLMHT